MRPLALALLLFPAASFAAQPAPAADPRAPLGEAFADGRAPASGDAALADAARAVGEVEALFKADPKSPKLGDAVWGAYLKLYPKGERDDILARARLTYGLSSREDFEQSMRKLAQRADRLPPGQAKLVQARLARMKAAFGQMNAGDGALGGGAAGGIAAGGRDDGARQAALARYKAARNGPAIRVTKGEPPPVDAAPPGSVKFDGVVLNQKQQARVGAEVANLRGVLDADNLNGYVTETDKKQLTGAWGRAVAHNVDAAGQVPSMKKTVNDFRDILLNGREAHDGTTRVAEHWGEMAVGTYSVGAWASLPASLAWNTFSITKSQLVRSYRYIRGQGPPPPAGNYWGNTMNTSLVTESAAAGWASALPGADHQRAVDGVVETLKLDEFARYVKQNGLLTTAGQMKDRYSQ